MCVSVYVAAVLRLLVVMATRHIDGGPAVCQSRYFLSFFSFTNSESVQNYIDYTDSLSSSVPQMLIFKKA